MFDEFLNELSEYVPQTSVLMIAGNHDNAQRLNYASSFLEKHHIYVSVLPPQQENEHLKKIELQDEWGTVNFYLLPFVKPAVVRHCFPEEEISSYTDAVRTAISHMPVDSSRRNILLAHQFVTGASTCESEEIFVGGTENVDASVFDGFDYVALGHLHSPQQIQRPTLRYGGSPLKYSLSEARQKKQMVLVELRGKGDTSISFVPYRPLHDLREIKGNYDQIMQEGAADVHFDDYVHITLTDEHMIPDAKARLHTVYPHIMELRYANIRLAYQQELVQKKEAQTPLAFVEELYELQNNQPMAQQQRSLIEELLEEIEEGL